MTDLERELAHARAMSTATHKPTCEKPRPANYYRWRPPYRPDPDCPGCVTDADRHLWKQLAIEYQQQLDRHRQETLL